MSKDLKIEKVKGLFAFWRYDLYPYILGSEIDAMTAKGSVHAPAYCKSFADGWFTPVKVMPVVSGRELNAKLEKLRADKRAADIALDTEWNKTLFDLMPEARSPEYTYAGFPRKVDDKK